MSRFVKPDTVTLPISDGDTITIRKRLTNGERRAMFARMYKDGVTPMRLDTWATGLSMVVAYLLDWTLTDDAGERVRLRDAAGVPLAADELAVIVDGLDWDSFVEIKDAIEAHVTALGDDLVEEKKVPATATAS
jgi:hypothetical protein